MLANLLRPERVPSNETADARGDAYRQLLNLNDAMRVSQLNAPEAL